MKTLLTLALAFLVTSCGNPNAVPTYGELGAPKNCRAIIAANEAGWRSGQYTADEAMNSITRNCGANGISWGRR